MNSLKNKELVSIILVNWNGEKWLNRCLSTLSNQSYKNIEIILVDNASSDNSINFVEKKFPDVKIVNNSINFGFPKANNIGVKLSKGKFLLLINPDVWIKKDFIEKLLSFYKKNNYSVVSPIEKKYDKKKQFYFNSSIDLTGSPATYAPQYRKDKLFFTSVAYLCKKKEYLDTKGFDENYFAYYEDVDWFWRMSLLGKKFAYAENIFVYHAGAGSTGKGIKYNMFLFRNQNALQTLLKNYSLQMLILILPLYIIQNVFEILFFVLILKFDIAYSYIEGWTFNIRNIRKILKKRAWIQKRRVISDWEILKKMYWGPAKLKMLINYKNEK